MSKGGIKKDRHKPKERAALLQVPLSPQASAKSTQKSLTSHKAKQTHFIGNPTILQFLLAAFKHVCLQFALYFMETTVNPIIQLSS